ncbi:MAG: hypothetical protein IJT48_09365 [Bacteroidaceae bacterium]|nr:hypothetical protein [Bacteroidaceae bacterium]
MRPTRLSMPIRSSRSSRPSRPCSRRYMSASRPTLTTSANWSRSLRHSMMQPCCRALTQMRSRLCRLLSGRSMRMAPGRSKPLS